MLHVSLKCQYAIKALVRLAATQSNEPVQAREIARFGGIPAKFLEQVMHDLRTAGLVRSLRGKNGGYTLTCDPAQITFAVVIDVIEGSHGGAGRMPGDDQAQRLVEPVWQDVRQAVRGVLESATIADAAARTAAPPMYFI